MPFTTGLAAAVAVLGVLGPLPAVGATTTAGVAGTPVRSQDVRGQEWWLAGLHVTQAWQTSVGAGITVAVLGTGVDLGAADLAGDVTTGPDFTGSGRTPGSPFWGFEGTAVSAIIAGHGHGAGDRSGIVGIAPAARILSVRVTLEFNDPLSSDASISRRLPQAIADGITYAVAHGARIIDLPLDPGTLGLTGQGDPAAAGGSPAERAAVDYAQGQGVVLVAPAGDDGMGPGIVNYPAAYPGVIAVGAVSRSGQLASFSSRRSYVSLTAPGVGLEAPDLADGYQMTSSTSAASGMVAGVAALIMSRFPHLTAAQVTQALTESTADVTGATGLPPLPARSPSGAGYGTVDAARAIQMAALITAASQPPPVQPVRPRKPARRPVAAPRRPGASALAGSVLRAAVAAVCVLIVLLVVMILVMRSRRERGARGKGRPRPRSGPGAARAAQAGPRSRTARDRSRQRHARPTAGDAAGTARRRPVALARGLAGRRHRRDRPHRGPAVPAGRDLRAESRAQPPLRPRRGCRRQIRGAALGARAGTWPHARPAPGGLPRLAASGARPGHPRARRHGGAASRGRRAPGPVSPGRPGYAHPPGGLRHDPAPIRLRPAAGRPGMGPAPGRIGPRPAVGRARARPADGRL